MPAANLMTTITIMLFEGGALIDALSAGTLGQALAAKVEYADQVAMAAGKTEFDLELDPIEIGMAINALTNGNSELSRQLGQKVESALEAKLQELGVAYGSNGGSVGGSAGTGLGDEQPTDGQNPPSDAPVEGDGQPAESTDEPAASPADENEGPNL